MFSPFTSGSQAQLFAAHSECPKGRSDQPAPLPLALARKARKREMTRFSKRRKTYIRRAHELAKDCDSQVFTVIRKNNRLFVYNSDPQDATWPPTTNDIVSKPTSGQKQALTYSIQARAYPLPQIFTPYCFEQENKVLGKHDLVQ